MRVQKTQSAEQQYRQEGDSLPLTTRDLLDALTRSVVKATGGADDDAITTVSLMAVCVVVPKGEVEFLSRYEFFAGPQDDAATFLGTDGVVPMSAQRLTA